MNLKLNKPLVFIDLETTGFDFQKDRIVELCAIKVNQKGNREELLQRFNPGMHIPKQASEIHGITNEDVVFEPYFEDVAEKIADFFKDCDVAGYNVLRFDLPFLAEALLRASASDPFAEAAIIDAMVIFHRKVPRSLAGALHYYRNEELVDAHSAKADVEATIKVLTSQLEIHDDLPNDSNTLSSFIMDGQKIVDYAGYFKKDKKGKVLFNFGKNKGKPVTTDLGYLKWMLNSDFPKHTLQKAQEMLLNSNE